MVADPGDPERVPCPLCGGTDIARVCDVERYERPFQVARCRACTLLHVNPRPSAAALDAMYDDAYYAGEADFSYADERKTEQQVRVRAEGRLARVARLLEGDEIGTRRVVEIGSAFGVFLDEARRLGWEARGCEISPASARHAEEHFGLEIARADLADAGLPDGSADLVTGSEVIEHLASPVRTAEAAYRVLAPGGVVLFSTANERSVARLLRGAAWGYYMPGHVVLWSARTLARLLRTAGFEDVDVTAGDERGLGNYLRFRKAAGKGSVIGWLARRCGAFGWTLGAGMVVRARKPRGAPR